MESDKPPSTVSAAITIEADEPIKEVGKFTSKPNGFVLEFGTNQGTFVIDCDGAFTLKAAGLLSYTLDFIHGGSVEVKTSFGGVNLTMEPICHSVKRDGDIILIELSYFICDGNSKSKKDIKLKAEIGGVENEN